MLFREVQKGSSVFILDKQNFKVSKGVVLENTFPKMDMNSGFPSKMVVDVTIEADGRKATYSIPENLSLTYDDSKNLVLSTDRNLIREEVEIMHNNAQKALDSIDIQREIVEKTSTLLEELSPELKEKKETEKRICELESAVKNIDEKMNGGFVEMKGMLEKFFSDLKRK